jgi:hypothetical protein
MYTHKPVRDGSVVSISIYGEYGAKFARRIAEAAVNKDERLGANLDVITVGDRQKFLFAVEVVTPTLPPPAAVHARGHWHWHWGRASVHAIG